MPPDRDDLSARECDLIIDALIDEFDGYSRALGRSLENMDPLRHRQGPAGHVGKKGRLAARHLAGR